MLAIGGICAVAWGDTFLLKQGGRIQGEWINEDETPHRRYVIETPEGLRMEIWADQVDRRLPDDPHRPVYERRLREMPDTLEGHWELAEWCRENRLKEERNFHLRRILQIDTDHAGARHGLGYSFAQGRWTTKAEIQREQGRVLFEGRWLLPQEVALLKADRQVESQAKRWLLQITRWREMLQTENAAEAYQNIARINDRFAVPALAELLRREPLRDVKMLYLDVLERIGNRAATGVLVHATLNDPDEEIFHASLQRLVKLNSPHLARQYLPVLKDENNVRLNRAAYSLGAIDDPVAISALIEVLTTTHYIVLPAAPSDSYTATFARPGQPGGMTPSMLPGSGGFSAGSEERRIPVTVNNQPVLDALAKLSGGVNLGFDKSAWRYWLAAENAKHAPDFNSRRDGE
jgi:hypothetical protein